MANVDALMKLLSFDGPFTRGIFNPWIDNDPMDVIYGAGPLDRVTRLRRHFDVQPRLLLIGEAPGYAGCHFSGVPFTNERLILEGMIPRVSRPGQARITTRRLPWSEPSATIVWNTLHAHHIAEHTVMWNAFPFHPHKPGDVRSNRAPTEYELEQTRPILEGVMAHFKGALVVAVGAVAERSIKRLGFKLHGRVRHPSMGGAREFREQIVSFCTPF